MSEDVILEVVPEPEETEDSIEEADILGYSAAAMYVLELARQISAGEFEVMVVPDPDGENPSGQPGIFIQIVSTKFEELGATMVIGYDMDSLKSAREAIVVVSGRVWEAEAQKEEEKKKSKLITPPEKKLIVPGE